ncbi:hypothetical protein Slin14017_G084750 [Septoria linicola]|nr:hypothetical protein Slin14017_G084750 [Septoria linicola]
MDPIYLQARNKHKLPKLQQQDQTQRSPKKLDQSDLTPFQKELAMNPYARALATPIRLCALSRARLPSHFLLPFGLFVPAAREADSTNTASTTKSGSGSGKPFYRLLTPQNGFHPKGMIGQASYVQATYSTVKSLGEKRGKIGRYVKLANQKAREEYAKLTKRASEGSVNPAKEWEWDVNMAEVVLEVKRKDAVEALSHVAELGLLETVVEVVPEEVAAIVRCGPGGGALPGIDRPGAEYDLLKLCGELHVKQLSENTGIREVSMVIVKDVKSVDALMALEKLRNYAEG